MEGISVQHFGWFDGDYQQHVLLEQSVVRPVQQSTKERVYFTWLLYNLTAAAVTH